MVNILLERQDLLRSPVNRLRLEGLKIATDIQINDKTTTRERQVTLNTKIDCVSGSASDIHVVDRGEAI
jgi:hypothetical protein